MSPGSTIIEAVYQETLKILNYAIRRKTPGFLTKGLGVLLLHDNIRPHSAAATVNLLNSWGWEILPHPPYSPDLPPSGFHLFPQMKNTSEVSASTPMMMFKMKSRNGCVSRTHFFYE
jgi:transposase